MYFPRLERLRMERGKTQGEIAEYLICQREVYRRYEKGTRQIPVDYLIRLAVYYCVSIDYLVGLTDDPKPYNRKALRDIKHAEAALGE